MVLRDMGKAGLAVMVLGAAACATESSDDPDTTESADPGTNQPPATTTTSSEPTPTSSPTSRGLEWHRVNLGFVSAYILYRAGEAAVIDTGVSGSEGAIQAGLDEIGLGWDSVGHVIVTHKHPDHQGSLEAVLALAADAPWYAGAGDMAAITASSSGRTVGDGDNVFDLKIIETPGHTPGHLSVLDPAGAVLVTGDALNGADGGIIGANPQFSEDMELANASIGKLAGLAFEVALFGHGDPVLTGAAAAVQDLAAGL